MLWECNFIFVSMREIAQDHLMTLWMLSCSCMFQNDVVELS